MLYRVCVSSTQYIKRHLKSPEVFVFYIVVCCILYYTTYKLYKHYISTHTKLRTMTMALTIQQVHNTADQLQGQGIKPTLAEVRKALGGGSFTTISEAMKSWRQDNNKKSS